jgi:hypothetical protein
MFVTGCDLQVRGTLSSSPPPVTMSVETIAELIDVPPSPPCDDGDEIVGERGVVAKAGIA